jgi:serine phosphatase RsbU (regulator of sigma subunit)
MRAEALLEVEASPEKVLSSVNDKLCKNNEWGMFVTIFCGILDLTTGRLIYANGSHNPPLTDIHSGRYDFIALPHGLIAGVFEGIEYHSAVLSLRPGQTLYLYTDGVTEAANPDNLMFSEERLRDTLAGKSGISAKTLIEKVRQDLAFFVDHAPQSDDLTMLAIRYLG